jgi:uncharacterized protein YbjT (DUF2867 family)
MSEVVRICLVGATGLVGTTLINEAVDRADVRIVGIARREVELPAGARMEMLVGETSGWPAAIAQTKARVLVCALGTTWRKSGQDEAAFRAVDHDLVLSVGRAAKDAGINHMIVVSSVGADAASRNRYLRVKGEMEQGLAKLGFKRLDILRPGLIRGRRAERRKAERLGMWLSPFADMLLHGVYRKYRSMSAEYLSRAILVITKEKGAGRFVHEYDSLRRAVRRVGG